MVKRLQFFIVLMFTLSSAYADDGLVIATSKRYVDSGLAQKASIATVSSHTTNISNPHGVTKAQVGLENVKNVDQTNASNLATGTVAYGRLPVGTAANTVVAGNDSRIVNSVRTTGTFTMSGTYNITGTLNVPTPPLPPVD